MVVTERQANRFSLSKFLCCDDGVPEQRESVQSHKPISMAIKRGGHAGHGLDTAESRQGLVGAHDNTRMEPDNKNSPFMPGQE